MDSDLTKHVIVSRLGQEITVQVRYASDVVLEEDVHPFRTNGPVEIGRTTTGERSTTRRLCSSVSSDGSGEFGSSLRGRCSRLGKLGLRRRQLSKPTVSNTSARNTRISATKPRPLRFGRRVT